MPILLGATAAATVALVGVHRVKPPEEPQHTPPGGGCRSQPQQIWRRNTFTLVRSQIEGGAMPGGGRPMRPEVPRPPDGEAAKGAEVAMANNLVPYTLPACRLGPPIGFIAEAARRGRALAQQQ